MYHEMQMHRRQFVCGECDEKYTTTTSMTAHLRSHHSTSFTESQLFIALDMCNRPIDETEKSLCLLCGTEMYLSKLQDHLAMHMENIALFVLPSILEDGKMDGDSISNQAANLDGWRGRNSDGASSLESLHVSNTGSEPNHKQTPADFRMLSDMEQKEVDSKIASLEEDGLPQKPDLNTTIPNIEPIKGSFEVGNAAVDSTISYPLGELEFYFKIDAIGAKAGIQSHAFANGSYKPPVFSNHYEQCDTTGWWLWKISGICSPKAPRYSARLKYSTTIFYDSRDTKRFLFHPADCRETDIYTAENAHGEMHGWRQLCFTEISSDQSCLDHHGEHPTLGGQAETYTPHLLPSCYESPEHKTKCGLSGKMSLLLGLTAFSCAPERMMDAIGARLNIRKRRWDNLESENWGDGRKISWSNCGAEETNCFQDSMVVVSWYISGETTRWRVMKTVLTVLC
jgi:hypothetical protein